MVNFIIFQDRELDQLDQSKDGSMSSFANFKVLITDRFIIDDGSPNPRTELGLKATLNRKTKTFRIPAEDFNGRNWLMSMLGPEAYIEPGAGARDRFRYEIQKASYGHIKETRIYQHTGWIRGDDGKDYFLHGGGALGANGPKNDAHVELDNSLARYALPKPLEGPDLQAAFESSLKIMDLGNPQTTVAVWLSPFRAVIEKSEFSVFINGEYQSGKTELAMIACGHHGSTLDGKNVLERFVSSTQGIQLSLYLAKDVIGVVDDFKPTGNRKQIHEAMAKIDEILRCTYGTKSRSTITSDRKKRVTGWMPRGLTIITAENLPNITSGISRTFVVDWRKGEIDWNVMTQLQKDRELGLHSGLMASFIRWMAKDRAKVIEARKKAFDAAWEELRNAPGLNRSAQVVMDLWSAWPIFEAFALEHGLADAARLEALGAKIKQAMRAATESQAEHRKESDPVEAFKVALVSALSAGDAYLDHAEPGPLPEQWTSFCGWRDGKGQGKRLGYFHPGKAEVWLEGGPPLERVTRFNEVCPSQKTLFQLIASRNHLAMDQTGNTARRKPSDAPARRLFYVLKLSYLLPDCDTSEASMVNIQPALVKFKNGA
jgi:hypothetical protein